MNKRIARCLFVITSILCCGPNPWAQRKDSQRKYDDQACVKDAQRQYKATIDGLFEQENLTLSQGHGNLKPITPLTLVPPPPRLILDFSWFETLFRELDCIYPPIQIYDRDLKPYYTQTNLPSPLCRPNSIIFPLAATKDKILDSAASVGRLAISRNGGEASFWGTAFMVAAGVIATPCHVIGPLLTEDNKALNLQDDEKLVISFQADGNPAPNPYPTEFEVKSYIGCSNTTGLDLALLDLCGAKKGVRDCAGKFPAPLPLFMGSFADIHPSSSASRSSDNEVRQSILLGYADLEHFIDPDKRDMYDPWVPESADAPTYGKFVMGDVIAAEDTCDPGLDIILDTDETTVGESGSVVIDFFQKDNVTTVPGVVGVHTCCSAYFDYDQGKPPAPEPAMKCAELRRTFHNQDISSWSILKDPELCKVLSETGAQQVDVYGNVTKVTCSGR